MSAAAPRPLGPQGFADAWAPIFFFALAMDYTVPAQLGHGALERTGDPRAGSSRASPAPEGSMAPER